MSYDSASLTTPDIKWLGVRPSDLDRYNIPEQCRLDMTDHDIKTGKELLQVCYLVSTWRGGLGMDLFGGGGWAIDGGCSLVAIHLTFFILLGINNPIKSLP